MREREPKTLYFSPSSHITGEEGLVRSISNDGSIAEVVLSDGTVTLAKVLK